MYHDGSSLTAPWGTCDQVQAAVCGRAASGREAGQRHAQRSAAAGAQDATCILEKVPSGITACSCAALSYIPCIAAAHMVIAVSCAVSNCALSGCRHTLVIWGFLHIIFHVMMRLTNVGGVECKGANTAS